MEIKRFKEFNYGSLVEVNPTQVVDYVCMDCFNVTGKRIRNITRERKEFDDEIWELYGEMNSKYDVLYINDENGFIYEIEKDDEDENRSYLHSYVTHTCPKCGGDTYAIDVDIIPHIIELNKKGYKTEYSCSGHGHKDIRAREITKADFAGNTKTIKRNKVYYTSPYVKFQDKKALRAFANYVKITGYERIYMPDVEYSCFSVYPNKWNIINTKEDYDTLLKNFLELCKDLPNLVLPIDNKVKDEDFKLILKDYGENNYYAVRDLETLEEFKKKMENLEEKPNCELTDQQKKSIEAMTEAFKNGELTIDINSPKWLKGIIPDFQPRLYQRMLMDSFFMPPRQSGKTWAIEEYLKNKGEKITKEIDLDNIEGRVLDITPDKEETVDELMDMIRNDFDDLTKRILDFDFGTPRFDITRGPSIEDIERELEDEITHAFKSENEYSGIDDVEPPTDEELARAMLSEFNTDTVEDESIDKWNLAIKENKLGLTKDLPLPDFDELVGVNVPEGELMENIKDVVVALEDDLDSLYPGPGCYIDEDYLDEDDYDDDEEDW